VDEKTKIKSLWAGIRNCNTFIDKIDEVPDMLPDERAQWKAEVQVLKAYYHYYLLQMYGPIPFMDENLDISLTPEEVQREREPVDQVVSKIVKVLDEAIESNGLQPAYVARRTELGRINLPVALAIKAKVLVLAASPIFNGNTEFSSFVNSEGAPFINPVYSVKKWQDAADACKAAIAAAHNASLNFYTFDKSANSLDNITDTTQLELNLRGQLLKMLTIPS